ncbi:cell wall metabolism sensor histidine kinase WalK [Williamsia sp. CHRR-6]|uniref:sensor histidine kinase n=1 Tax=Williamsia sp. CHRR-6 TaxID=2835871 RepID=UPI001BD93715|nr:HAMP domain-containing sensor histidine kinase [Williamsia sp. CHRR-6]MBT0566906.1 HAMP domain-containing histidine kinase [Williamsia sp. CHRR-6]
MTTGVPVQTTRRRRGIPLRVSLVALMLVLVAVGLLVSGVAVTSAMEKQLLNRTDNGLRNAAQGWARPHVDRDNPGAQPTLPRPPQDERRPPSPYFVQVSRTDGISFIINDVGGAPDISSPNSLSPQPKTVGSANGSDTRWRVVKVTSTYGSSILAVKLTDVDDTVTRLIWLQFGVGLAVVAVVGGVGYLLVHNSLRPLRRVEATARAIADGDLDQRVPTSASGTEVGRLAESLNVMLHQIQEAFAATEQSEEQARASEDRMRQFVADASHELRTPLTSIRGFAELYRQGAMTDPEQLMSRIESEAGRMGLLVEELLMLARLDAHRPLERTHVDLLALASDSVHSARAMAPDRRIDLRVLDGPGVPAVMGDAARLTQVLGNLITNAVKHTPADASISVEVGTDDTDAVLRVVDTGPGLAPEDRAKVFERFYRGDDSRTRATGSGGSGLGLSIVSALVTAHDGTVTAQDTPGGGATFVVRLPRSQ